MGVTITDCTDFKAFIFENFGLPGRAAIADQLPPPGPVHDTKGTCHSVERVPQKGEPEQGRGRAFLVL